MANLGGAKEGPTSSDVTQTGKETHGGVNPLKSRDHHLKQKANDLDHPHTLDRKSGTGEQAFG